MDSLRGLTAAVTSGPTRERIDPVRYITNDSSGKQGHLIAAALAKAGVAVTLISGKVDIADPEGVAVVRVESAKEMLAACLDSLPVDIAICAAAVSDFQPETILTQKFKKNQQDTLTLSLVQTPDILKTVSNHPTLRPKLVIGFAAETENLLENAQGKLHRKGCDIILANDVCAGEGVFGSDYNTILLVSKTESEQWPHMSKKAVAEQLVEKIKQYF